MNKTYLFVRYCKVDGYYEYSVYSSALNEPSFSSWVWFYLGGLLHRLDKSGKIQLFLTLSMQDNGKVISEYQCNNAELVAKRIARKIINHMTKHAMKKVAKLRKNLGVNHGRKDK